MFESKKCCDVSTTFLLFLLLLSLLLALSLTNPSFKVTVQPSSPKGTQLRHAVDDAMHQPPHGAVGHGLTLRGDQIEELAVGDGLHNLWRNGWLGGVKTWPSLGAKRKRTKKNKELLVGNSKMIQDDV